MGAEYFELDFKQEDLAGSDVYLKEMSEAFIQAEVFLLAKQVKRWILLLPH